jgi:hypothetical protein
MLEAKHGITDLDAIVVGQLGALGELVVDQRAVARAAVGEHPSSVGEMELEVLSRDRDVRQHHLIVESATDGDHRGSAQIEDLALVGPLGHHQFSHRDPHDGRRGFLDSGHSQRRGGQVFLGGPLGRFVRQVSDPPAHQTRSGGSE